MIEDAQASEDVAAADTVAPGERVAADVAEVEFDRFCETMDLDVSPDNMTDEDREGFNRQKAIFVGAVRKGSLTVDDKGQPVFTPQASPDCSPITFREPTGASLMSMDSKKKNHDVTKLYALMADVTGTSVGKFRGMVNRDLNVCMAVITLFLG